jgi:hypothetical protein
MIYKKSHFRENQFGEIWPKATGLTGNLVLDIHITL